jgi:hypothetical protein
MHGGGQRSGVMIYIAIAILIVFMSYFFVKALQHSDPQQPRALLHDSK